MIDKKDIDEMRALCDRLHMPRRMSYSDAEMTAMRQDEYNAIQALRSLINEHDDLTTPMPCGHPVGAVSYGDEGTNFCRWCEEVGRLEERLAAATKKEA